ncbi:MAG: tetratricopeptide repeat protein [Acidobacteriota bacterium]|nr:tetratricopeptide repeat protein [Acidobacteriota bacterium]
MTRVHRSMLVVLVIAGAAAVAAPAVWRTGSAGRVEASPSAPVTARGTGPEELADGISAYRARLSASPSDHGAAVALADLLMRKSRVDSDASLAIEAERIVRAALEKDPGNYHATRMLASVLLAQHRFADALPVAERARAVHPEDAWNHGTSGDAWMELGDYDKAFDAFDRMVRTRPDASSYARVAYAREKQGDLDGALRTLRMSAEATGPTDRESLSWHASQAGNLLLRQGKLDDAEREFRRAEHLFAGHPYARAGQARLLVARGSLREALVIVEEDLRKAATPELAAWAGDLCARLGNAACAAERYAEMERLERSGWESEEPQPAALGRMLAERSLKAPEALALAERAAASRNDIFTMDAVAWAAFRAGDLKRASEAATAAMRTGTRDQRILAHAAAIALATGDRARARTLAAQALDGGVFDLIAFDEAGKVLKAAGAAKE